MNNVEKGYLLARLFPDTLQELTGVLQKRIDFFGQHREMIYGKWEDTLITAHFWYGLVESTQRIIRNQGVSLHRSARVFSDHLFDGYNAIFTISCLIDYTEQENCPYKLRQAIHLLFGEDKLFRMDI